MEQNSCCNGASAHNHGKKGLIIFLLLVSIASNVGSAYFFSKQAAKEAMDQYLTLEYAKSGGKENYELLAKAQSLQLKGQIAQIKQYVEQNDKKGADTATNDTTKNTDTTTSPSAGSKLSKDEITAIKEDAYIEGNKNAVITLVEYSDLECPFCIRQYRDGTIQKMHEKFGDKVNSAFKNFRGVPHENAEIEASALLCAGEMGGKEVYVSYYNKIFERTNGGNGTGFSKDALTPLAKELKLDGKKFQECLDSKKNIARFDAETAEGKKLGVQGTPGTVVINNETGEYELIAGAYPASEFERVINKLLGNK